MAAADVTVLLKSGGNIICGATEYCFSPIDPAFLEENVMMLYQHQDDPVCFGVVLKKHPEHITLATFVGDHVTERRVPKQGTMWSNIGGKRRRRGKHLALYDADAPTPSNRPGSPAQSSSAAAAAPIDKLTGSDSAEDEIRDGHQKRHLQELATPIGIPPTTLVAEQEQVADIDLLPPEEAVPADQDHAAPGAALPDFREGTH